MLRSLYILRRKNGLRSESVKNSVAYKNEPLSIAFKKNLAHPRRNFVTVPGLLQITKVCIEFHLS